jgi:molecular chaperone HscB
MKLDSDDFELMGVPRRFAQDRSMLDASWRALQGQVHPDRFVAEGAAAQRIAMQWAVRVDEAYQRLKNPLKRAAYLCELNGASVDAENNTAMPADFLMQQMEWREALDARPSIEDVQTLNREVAARRDEGLLQLQALIDQQQDFAVAAQQVRALMFIERFADDIDQRLEALEQ